MFWRAFGPSKVKRKLNPDLFKDSEWLRYSEREDAVHCSYCVLFGGGGKEKAFISSGIKDWTNVHSLVNRHKKAGATHHGCTSMADNFLKISERRATDIAQSVNHHTDQEKARNRHVLSSIVKTLLLCGRQNIAVRGHTNEKSNIVALLNLQAEKDPVLKSHLGHPSQRYLSPKTQNEIPSISGDQIRQKIFEECSKAGCVSVLADETTDKSGREQLCICVRFVKDDGSVDEDFLGFEHAVSMKGEALAELIMSTLGKYGVDAPKMVGQGYDGAANMSGKYRGVQAKITSIHPNAAYIHCKAHCLNLAIVHACKDASIRCIMDKIQEIAFSFSYNSKKLLEFKEKFECIPS